MKMINEMFYGIFHCMVIGKWNCFCKRWTRLSLTLIFTRSPESSHVSIQTEKIEASGISRDNSGKKRSDSKSKEFPLCEQHLLKGYSTFSHSIPVLCIFNFFQETKKLHKKSLPSVKEARERKRERERERLIFSLSKRKRWKPVPSAASKSFFKK